MAEYLDREHYIPLRKSDLVELLCADKGLPVAERAPFRQFCRLAAALYHFEYLQHLEKLKDAYAPFDPDSETRPLKPLLPEERAERQEQVFAALAALLERANFKKLTREDVLKAVHDTPSDWGLPTDIDLSMFERLDVYHRGDGFGVRRRRLWWKLWLKEEIKVPVHHRLVGVLKLRRHRRLDPDINTDAIYLKIFKDIPKADVPMLLPGARVRLSKLDRALIVYPLAAGVGLLLWHLGATIWEAITTAAVTGLLSVGVLSAGAALGGYGYKSYYSYQVRKQTYNFQLTRNLYYQGLDSNAGVLMRLLDEAEEQECREVFLAYFCLWRFAPPQGWTAEQLDDYVELYLEGSAAALKVDFEIGDALDKLEKLKIVQKVGDHYRAVPLNMALVTLDRIWDNIFQYNTP
jgi:hypothetical protein